MVAQPNVAGLPLRWLMFQESADNKASEPLDIAKQGVLEPKCHGLPTIKQEICTMTHLCVVSLCEAQTPDAALYWLACMIDTE